MNQAGLRGLALVSLTVALGVGGCGLFASKSEVPERMGRGPRAEEMFYAKISASSDREPNFDEKRQWKDQMDERVFKYLRDHPEMEQTTRYSEFRFWLQVSEGSTPSEVRALLDEPLEQTIDPALMKMKAKTHWTQISSKAKEAWTYPLGWVLFFDDKGVVEMIRRTPPQFLLTE